MARQHGIVHVTTLNPAKPGLDLRIVKRTEGSDVEGETLLSGTLDEGGAWTGSYTDLSEDTLVALILTEADGTELIRWRGILRNLNPMECFMTNPPRLSEAELHKRWRAKYRELRKSGVQNPDADDVARAAFKY